jgi:DNA mismatch repair ATPase MutL
MTSGNNRPFNNEVYRSFFSFCMENDLDMVKSIISTERKSLQPFYDYIFAVTCSTKNVEIVKCLSSTENQSLFGDLKETFNSGLILAAKENQLEVIKYLVSLKEINYLSSFESLCETNMTNTLKYLIFDLNIEHTSEIDNYLKKRDNEGVQNMFKIRIINEQLTQELDASKSNKTNKHNKI